MFNKPNLFPKANEVVPPRGGRLVPGGQTGSGLQGDALRDTGSGLTPGGQVAAAGAQSSAATAPDSAKSGESRLIVGPDVKLKGAEILDCDTLVVEGRVEATMDSRVLRIAEDGSYSGTVGIDVAEIHGQFDGELTARSQLIIHATGRVSGKIRYGKIFIEEGGEISGDIKSIDSDGLPSKRSTESESKSNGAEPLRADASAPA